VVNLSMEFSIQPSVSKEFIEDLLRAASISIFTQWLMRSTDLVFR